jgi:sugar lactone lactonase YvrE
MVLQKTVIASGLPARTDPAALVIGPTGLALDADADQLFVNDTLRNRIARVVNPLFRSTSAGIGLTLTHDGALNDPLGLTRAPNGDIIAANGNDGKLVEVTPSGVQVDVKLVQPSGAGDLFGLVATSTKVYFVNDGTNTLNALQ